jgi:hypothetical protein
MNKKFIKVVGIILISLTLFIGLSSFITKDNKFGEDVSYENTRPTFTYKSSEVEDNNKVITILVKNNSNDIASPGEFQLSFDSMNGSSDFYIRGYEKSFLEENIGDIKRGIDPGEEIEVIFKIPNGIKFDEDVYDLKIATISYDINYYKFRVKNNGLFLGVGGEGGSHNINID